MGTAGDAGARRRAATGPGCEDGDLRDGAPGSTNLGNGQAIYR